MGYRARANFCSGENQLKLLFYVFANQHTGYGHYYRSLALAQAAIDRGHTVYIASDKFSRNCAIWLSSRYNKPTDLARILSIVKPDWLIVDLPDTLPGWIEDMATCKICVLNGIGYDQANNVALRVIQGVADLKLPKEIDLSNTVMGVDYVIIRPEIERFKNLAQTIDFFVWGGGNDHLRLLDRFGQIGKDWSAYLIQSPMLPGANGANGLHKPMISKKSLDIFQWLGWSKRACCAMGMIVWEAAYLQVPAWIFSYSPLHLMFAQGMQKHGLIKAWPGVGLPESDEDMREFLDSEFVVSGKPPDGKGADRIVRIME